jgi:lipocalin-like protein
MEHDQLSFIGAWKLISFEFRKDDGESIYPFGERALGSIIYTEAGRYSAQLMRVDRPRFVVPDQMRGTAEEIEASYRGCISYFGSYEVDSENSFIIHRVEGSLFPNMEGSNQIRIFELSGDHMQLTTPPFKLDGEQAIGILQWKRIG